MMNSASSQREQMDRTLCPQTRESLGPHIVRFLNRLTDVQWQKLVSGCVDDKAKSVLTDMCVDLINIISKSVFEMFKQHHAKDAAKTPKTIPKKQVQDYLGDSILRTIAEVTSIKEDISCESAEELHELVAREVRQRVNSQLSKSSSSSGTSCKDNKLPPSKFFPQRLQRMVKCIVQVLRRCTGLKTTWISSVESIQMILEETASLVSGKGLDELTNIEVSELVGSISVDREKLALEILDIIQEEHKTEASRRQRVSNKVKAFFTIKFAKESIAKLVSKLRREHCCAPAQKVSLKKINTAMDLVMDEIIPEGEQENCIYEAMASVIHSDQHAKTVAHLGSIISNLLSRDSSQPLSLDLRPEMCIFMMDMTQWVDEQRRRNEVVCSVMKQFQTSPSQEEVDKSENSIPSKPREKVPVIGEAPTSTFESAVLHEKAHEAPPEATVSSLKEQESLSCLLLVTKLVMQIMKKKPLIELSGLDVRNVTMSLNKMLMERISESKTPVTLADRNIKQVAKAVHKDLCALMCDAGTLQMTLLSQDVLIFRVIIDTLITHLVSPPKKHNVVRRFLQRLFNKNLSA